MAFGVHRTLFAIRYIWSMALPSSESARTVDGIDGWDAIRPPRRMSEGGVILIEHPHVVVHHRSNGKRFITALWFTQSHVHSVFACIRRFLIGGRSESEWS